PHTNTVTLFGLTLICAGFSVGFGVAMSQALGPFRCAPEWPVPRSVSRRFAVHHCGIWLAAILGISAMNML
ncbi:multidrug efflux system protein MdtL, partial [Salmonella enterica subsp. enterica serovar Enteritidis str. CVM_69-4941]